MEKIEPGAVYTPRETEVLLKVSHSTIKRMLKKGLLRANKVGGQYRILGHELLRILSPGIDKKATNVYQKLKIKTIDKLKDW